MNMKNILKPTNDPNEMFRIGKQIWESNPEIYNERRRALLAEMLDEEMPDASKEDRDRSLFISIYDYWMYGVNLREDFFYHFPQLTHQEKLKYITCRTRPLYTHHLNDAEYAADLLDNKYNCYKRFREYYLRDAICIESEEDFESFKSFVDKHKTFVVKPLELQLGWGVHTQTVTERDDLHEAFISILDEGDAIQKKYHIKEHVTRFILDELIDQGEELKQFHPQSINCVRLQTIVNKGKVHFFYPWIKIGRHGSFISNAGSGGTMVGIDVKTGKCITDAWDEFCNTYEIHPDSGIRFKGYQIPKWDELLELGEKLALELAPRINCVGWDMAYTKAGWSILEANPDGEFIAQLPFGKGLKEELEDLLEWKPDVEYWWEDPVDTQQI